jgi:hypothetical protein
MGRRADSRQRFPTTARGFATGTTDLLHHRELVSPDWSTRNSPLEIVIRSSRVKREYGERLRFVGDVRPV